MIVKICGITRDEDARAAAQAGASAVGFIFVRSSKRWIEPARAREIISGLPSSVIPVGVFVNAPREQVRDVIATTGIRLLQFHGDEPPDEACGYGLPLWKGFRVKPDFDVRALARYAADGFLLDTFVEGMDGGTGRPFNWEIALAAKEYGPIILSGGINPDNVADAIRKVGPYAIDVNSGVETSPGVKDAAKINRLFDVLRQTKESLC